MNKLTPGSNLRWESSRMILPEYKEAYLEHQRKKEEANKKKEIPPIEVVFDDLQYEE